MGIQPDEQPLKKEWHEIYYGAITICEAEQSNQQIGGIIVTPLYTSDVVRLAGWNWPRYMGSITTVSQISSTSLCVEGCLLCLLVSVCWSLHYTNRVDLWLCLQSTGITILYYTHCTYLGWLHCWVLLSVMEILSQYGLRPETSAVKHIMAAICSLVILHVCSVWTLFVPARPNYTVPTVIGWAELGIYFQLDQLSIWLWMYLTAHLYFPFNIQPVLYAYWWWWS